MTYNRREQYGQVKINTTANLKCSALKPSWPLNLPSFNFLMAYSTTVGDTDIPFSLILLISESTYDLFLSAVTQLSSIS